MKALVTGGGGFLGGADRRRLRRTGRCRPQFRAQRLSGLASPRRRSRAGDLADATAVRAPPRDAM